MDTPRKGPVTWAEVDAAQSIDAPRIRPESVTPAPDLHRAWEQQAEAEEVEEEACE